MLITKIEKQKKREGRYSVFIDGEFCFGIDEIGLIQCKLKEDMEISEKQLNEIIETVVFEKAKNVATRYLGYRMRSENQVRKKLKENEFSEMVIDKVISLIKKYGYINDYEFAKAFLQDKQTLSKYGSRKISYDLRLAGVEKEIIARVMSENDVDEAEIALELLIKKTARMDNIDYKQKQKLFAYLARRGFSYDIIKIAFEDLIDKEEFGGKL